MQEKRRESTALSSRPRRRGWWSRLPGLSSRWLGRSSVHEGTLGAWVNKYRAEHAGEEPPLNLSERARLRELEREVRELRMKTEFLGKAAAFFAQEYR